MQGSSYPLSGLERAALEDSLTWADEWIAALPADSLVSDVMRGLRRQAEDAAALIASFAADEGELTADPIAEAFAAAIELAQDGRLREALDVIDTAFRADS
jgi:hypothetical protein